MKNLPEEQNIIERWTEEVSTPVVSILCITFNQQSYIESALQSFLMQETTFPFEVIVHDDASTDGTAEIIRIYQKRYPRIIKTICQTENQYSKVGFRLINNLYAVAKGEFYAFCEGDDYWTDPSKLESQVAQMRLHPECDISFHPATRIRSSDGEKVGVLGNIASCSLIIQPEEVLRKGIAFIPTCSLLVKSRFYRIENKYGDFVRRNGSSFFIKFLASLQGGALYIEKNMACYRVNAEGSHAERIKNDPEFSLGWLVEINKSFDECDQLTNFKYTRDVQYIKKRRVLNLLTKKRLNAEQKIRLFNSYKSDFGWIGWIAGKTSLKLLVLSKLLNNIKF